MSVSVNPAFSATGNSISARSEQISSGRRINSAADDAAGLSISTRMYAEVAGSRMAVRNAADGISFTQTASGALESVAANVSRIRELAVQAGNGILSDSDRSAIQSEINALNEENRFIVDNSSFNGQPLFTQNSTLSFQVGDDAGEVINVSTTQLTDIASAAGDVSTPQAASALIENSDADLQMLSSSLADLGASANRFEATIERLSGSIADTAQAVSRISDTDMAAVSSQRVSEQIKEQAQIAIQAQANASAPDILKLLN